MGQNTLENFLWKIRLNPTLDLDRFNQLTPYSTYHTNGSVCSIGNKLKGKKHGIWNHYYPNGFFHKHENYKMGVLDGTVREYDLRFRVISSVEYKDGKPI